MLNGKNEVLIKGSGRITWPKFRFLHATSQARVKLVKDGIAYFTSTPESFTPGQPFSVNRTWNGSFNGQLVPEGPFTVVLSVLRADGGEAIIATNTVFIFKKKKGEIILVALRPRVGGGKVPFLPAAGVGLSVLGDNGFTAQANTSILGFARIPVPVPSHYLIGVYLNASHHIEYWDINAKGAGYVALTDPDVTSLTAVTRVY